MKSNETKTERKINNYKSKMRGMYMNSSNKNIHETAATVSMDETQKSFCEQHNDSTDFSHIYDGRGTGWIKLYRSLLDHQLWLQEPYTKGQAFVELLLLANHAKNTVFIKNQSFIIERGQVARSILTLSKRWKWCRSKVTNFLMFLVKQQMISYKTNNSTTIITICNYDKYQGYANSEATLFRTATQQSNNNKRNTNNNKKKNNTDKSATDALKIPVEMEGAFRTRHSDKTWMLDIKPH